VTTHAFETATPILTVADTKQNVVGMSVVGPDFEKLKRFNLEELQQQPHVNKTDSSGNFKIEKHVDSSTNLKVEEHE
jgi:hypothetical protein